MLASPPPLVPPGTIGRQEHMLPTHNDPERCAAWPESRAPSRQRAIPSHSSKGPGNYWRSGRCDDKPCPGI